MNSRLFSFDVRLHKNAYRITELNEPHFDMLSDSKMKNWESILIAGQNYVTAIVPTFGSFPL